jgi:hypothetical protein
LKFNDPNRPTLIVLILCGAAFFQIPLRSNRFACKAASSVTAENVPTAVTANDLMHIQDNQLVISPLNPGEMVTGSIPAPAVAGDCLLGNTQYKIEFPGGARKLVIDIDWDGDQAVAVYVRHSSPIAFEGGKILADFKTSSPLRTKRLSLPQLNGNFNTGVPLLEPGAYFIAVTNCGPSPTVYTLSAKILDPPDAATVNLTFGAVEVGSIPPPEPGFCRLGRTQYVAVGSFDPCGGAVFIFGTIRADQNVNVYTRKGNPVTEASGIVVYDRVTPSQAKIQPIRTFQNTPGSELYYFAIENCSFDVVNYTVVSSALFGDPNPFFIITAFFDKKDLHVVGHFSGEGAMVVLDGQPQETIFGGRNRDFQEVLIIKKGKKKIARHQTVQVAVKRGICTTAPFLLTRP